MLDHAFYKAVNAAKRIRDQKIRKALRTEGMRPKKNQRRLEINAEFTPEKKVG
jgi:hypothetical protein